MRRFRRAGVVFAVLLAACASDRPASPVVVAAPEAPTTPAAPALDPVAPAAIPAVSAPVGTPDGGPAAGSFGTYLAQLSSVSCPAGAARTSGEALELSVKSVPLQALNPSRKTVGELAFIAGFHLTSPDSRFGGLSGIDRLGNGDLLAVSDQGDFVWIDLADDGVTPKAARIAGMRGASGEALRGKAEGDAEGLAINGGMALVSFERDHRVLAYDLGRCGAAARGAPIVNGLYSGPLAQAFARASIDVGANQGPEPLAVTRDWYLFTGIETKVGAQSPLSARPIEAEPDFDLRIGADKPEFVGLDVIASGKDGEDVRAFSLHRGFAPLAGNAIVIVETELKRELDQTNLPRRIISDVNERSHYRFHAIAEKTLAQLNILFNVDNFEGIAARELPDGRVRLYLISDDNFSKTQRTLFFVFETAR